MLLVKLYEEGRLTVLLSGNSEAGAQYWFSHCPQEHWDLCLLWLLHFHRKAFIAQPWPVILMDGALLSSLLL